MAIVACRVTLAAVVLLCAVAGVALGAKRVSITDDLRDVVDDEEDDDWRHWGAAARPRDDPPPDFSRMDPAAVQAELLRAHTGPSFGFVKLRPGVRRSQVRILRSPSMCSSQLPVIVRFVVCPWHCAHGITIPCFLQEDVMAIATRWSNVLRTGSVETKFVAVDFGTLMFTMERGRDVLELKEFILSQEEAYEFKIGDQLFRRPGDPPLDQVIEKLQKEKRDKAKEEL
ncbi:hypothetical protein PR202_gb18598 [Eleusine coracana subsp. coracana]|uniref:Mesoderm development candidate 2 n=1 Tax=Eleusine coracana subsp. coracana TaxID=191504 RepID=A0AAV5F5Z9_ELECO|nr:hypothetical protein PR202_gb18598 [Eleusine coracana subsp. coracana]